MTGLLSPMNKLAFSAEECDFMARIGRVRDG